MNKYDLLYDFGQEDLTDDCLVQCTKIIFSKILKTYIWGIILKRREKIITVFIDGMVIEFVKHPKENFYFSYPYDDMYWVR